MKKTLVFWIFLLFGIVFFTVGAVICIKVFDYSGKEEALALITDIEFYGESGNREDTKVKTYVSFETNGVTYNTSFGGYASYFEEGEIINIYYDINNPHNVGSKETDLALIAIPALGFFFVAFGGGMLILSCCNREKIEKIVEEDEKNRF